MIGLSTYTSGVEQAHAVMCGSGANAADFPQSTPECATVAFDEYESKLTNQLYQDPAPLGDWASGYYKGECDKGGFVAGVSQSTGGRVNGLLCCEGSVNHNNCEVQSFPSNNYPSYDWDDGYYKAECSPGQYVAGVSAATGNGAPHNILCCSP